MPNCTASPNAKFNTESTELGCSGRRVIEGRFDGGNITSGGGVMLLGATDQKLGLMDAAVRCITDTRNLLLLQHTVRDMLRQRIYGLALGWEDLSDHTALRQDAAMQRTVGADEAVARAPSLCRLENTTDRASWVRLHEVLVDQFIASFKTAPQELILDVDAGPEPATQGCGHGAM